MILPPWQADAEGLGIENLPARPFRLASSLLPPEFPPPNDYLSPPLLAFPENP